MPSEQIEQKNGKSTWEGSFLILECQDEARNWMSYHPELRKQGRRCVCTADVMSSVESVSLHGRFLFRPATLSWCRVSTRSCPAFEGGRNV